MTSDHGASFRPGDRFKSPSATNFSEILPVPLLIKLPAGQTAPIYQDDHLETIDILPTIAQLTGIGVPWEMDGRSALDATSPPRSAKTIYSQGGTRRHQYGQEAVRVAVREAVKRKVDLFGSGSNPAPVASPEKLWILGRTPQEIGVQGPSLDRVTLDLPALYERVDPASHFVPAQISGSLKKGRPTTSGTDLAIAVNGTIRATLHLEGSAQKTSQIWSAILPENSFRHGRNRIEVFTIHPAPSGQVLSRAYETPDYSPPRNFAVKTPGSLWAREEGGSHQQERWASRLVRWTDEAANLKVSQKELGYTPRLVAIRLARSGPSGTNLTIRSCGQPIFQNRIPRGRWSATLELRGCSAEEDELEISILSDTFVPKEVLPNSKDSRRLGVAVSSIVFPEG